MWKRAMLSWGYWWEGRCRKRVKEGENGWCAVYTSRIEEYWNCWSHFKKGGRGRIMRGWPNSEYIVHIHGNVPVVSLYNYYILTKTLENETKFFWGFGRNHIKPVHHVDRTDIFTKLSLPVHKHGLFPFLYKPWRQGHNSDAACWHALTDALLSLRE
jgi:hypothetical protein